MARPEIEALMASLVVHMREQHRMKPEDIADQMGLPLVIVDSYIQKQGSGKKAFGRPTIAPPTEHDPSLRRPQVLRQRAGADLPSEPPEEGVAQLVVEPVEPAPPPQDPNLSYPPPM